MTSRGLGLGRRAVLALGAVALAPRAARGAMARAVVVGGGVPVTGATAAAAWAAGS